MTTSHTYRVNSPHIVHEIFEDGEAAIINLKSGAYYSLDSVGASIWALLDQGHSQGEMVEYLTQRYEGSLVRMIDDVSTLVAALLAEDLIVPADGPGVRSGSARDLPAPAHKAPYVAPVFERFQDMQELLLLDPIHEVGEQGWPHARDEHA